MRGLWFSNLRKNMRGTPLYIVLVGVMLTVLIVQTQRTSEARERALAFAADVDRVERALVDGIDRSIEGFASSRSFVLATHPSVPGEFASFFHSELGELDEGDPGVMLVEKVTQDQIEELELRESLLRGSDFQVLRLPGASDERLVITRASVAIETLAVPIEGLDVSLFESLIFPDGPPETGISIRPLEASALTQFVRSPGDLEETLFLIVAPVRNIDRRYDGYVVQFVTMTELLRPLQDADMYHVAITASIEDAELSIRPMPESLTVGPSARRFGQRASLDWTLEVEMTEGYVAPNLVDNQTWILSLSLTAAAAASVIASNFHRNRLDEAEFELEHARALASTDVLTGLLNRQGLIDAARELGGVEAACLFFVDLDGFKAVNDDLGHDAGDRVLREVARHLRTIFRPQDVICRLGGDEFVIYTPGISSRERMTQISTEVTAALSAIESRITASVGVAHREPGAETDVKELMRVADAAMYSAKRAGGDRHSLAS